MHDQEYVTRIKDALKRKGITQGELSRMLGKSESWISSVLRGNYPYREGWYCPRYLSEWADSHLFGKVWGDEEDWIECDGHRIPRC
jgi:hypothetical protein